MRSSELEFMFEKVRCGPIVRADRTVFSSFFTVARAFLNVSRRAPTTLESRYSSPLILTALQVHEHLSTLGYLKQATASPSSPFGRCPSPPASSFRFAFSFLHALYSAFFSSLSPHLHNPLSIINLAFKTGPDYLRRLASIAPC